MVGVTLRLCSVRGVVCSTPVAHAAILPAAPRHPPHGGLGLWARASV